MLAASTLIFGAAYTLWMVKRVFFGAVTNEHVAHLSDITLREKLIFAILALCVLGMGLYPLPFGEMMHTTVNDLIVHLGHSKL
jgi:NADH-quinone oxidoreductase subunit M